MRCLRPIPRRPTEIGPPSQRRFAFNTTIAEAIMGVHRGCTECRMDASKAEDEASPFMGQAHATNGIIGGLYQPDNEIPHSTPRIPHPIRLAILARGKGEPHRSGTPWPQAGRRGEERRGEERDLSSCCSEILAFFLKGAIEIHLVLQPRGARRGDEKRGE